MVQFKQIKTLIYSNKQYVDSDVMRINLDAVESITSVTKYVDEDTNVYKIFFSSGITILTSNQVW